MALEISMTRYLTVGLGIIYFLVLQVVTSEEHFIASISFFNLVTLFVPLSRLGFLHINKENIYLKGGLAKGWYQPYIWCAILSALIIPIYNKYALNSKFENISILTLAIISIFFIVSSFYETLCYTKNRKKINVWWVVAFTILGVFIAIIFECIGKNQVSRLILVLPIMVFLIFNYSPKMYFILNNGSWFHIKALIVAVSTFFLLCSARNLFFNTYNDYLSANVILVAGLVRFVLFPIFRNIEKEKTVRSENSLLTDLIFVLLLSFFIFFASYFMTTLMVLFKGEDFIPMNDLKGGITLSFVLSLFYVFSLGILKFLKFDILKSFLLLCFSALSFIVSLFYGGTVYILFFIIMMTFFKIILPNSKLE